MSHLLKDIAVFFDASAAGRQILDRAAQLAGAQQAHLIGICAASPGEQRPQDAYAFGPALEDVAARQQSARDAQLLQAGQALAITAARYDIHAEFRVIPYSESGSAAALHALYCDLLMVAEPAVGTPLSWSTTQMLQTSGVPLLRVPAAWHGEAIGRHIVLAWNASRPARRAVADALPLLVTAATVDLLLIDAQPQAGGYGDDPGADMAAYLARHGVHVELLSIASHGHSVAEAILAEAAARHADLIVFGAYSRPRLREAVFGGVTRSLLAASPLPLFVSP